MKTRLAQRMFGAEGTPPRIGRYRVERRVGAGGMGVVYEGYDEQLERRVAIKLLHPDLDERHAVRMHREALALAKLSHPNVVHVYETGVHDGALFIVMEFVAGEQLSKWQRVQRGDWKTIIARYLEAGRGLAAAHAAGIVHRDFKPSNVVVCEEGPARVLDFGLARSFGAIVDTDGPGVLADGSALDARVTVTGTTMGTPAYMSPEQMLGQPTNASSDQFSFCVSLYEALYGERPFAGERAAEVYEALLLERIRPAPPTSKVPKRVRMLVLRGLRPRPEQRHASMSDLLRELEGSAQPSRWRPVLAIGTLGAVGAAWTFAASDAPCGDGADAASQHWDQRRGDVAKAFDEGAAGYADAALSSIDQRLAHFTSQWAEQYAAACELDDESARRRALSCLDEGRVALVSVTDVLASGGDGVVDHAFQLVDELAPPNDCAAASTEPATHADGRAELLSARLDALAGREDDARRKATAVLDAARGEQARKLIGEALLTLALVEREGARYEASMELLRAAAAEGLAADAPLLVADAWLETAHFQAGDSGALVSSREHSSNARALLERVSGEAGRLPGDRAARLAWIEGLQALTSEDGEGAAIKLREAVAGLEAAHDPHHTLVTRARLDLAHALAAHGKTDEALRTYDEGRAAMAELAGADYPRLCAFDYGIALVHLDLGEIENARVRLEAALALVANAGPAWAEHRGQILVALAQAETLAGHLDEALQAARRAKAELAAVLSPDHPTRRGADSELAVILLQRGELDASAEAFRDLVAGHQAAGDTLSASAVWARLVMIELRRGRHDDAAALLERHRDAITERFGAGYSAALAEAVAGMQHLATNEITAGRELLERARGALPTGQESNRWCDLRAWATLALARSLAADDPARADALAAEARAHLVETAHDPGLLAEVDAFAAR